MGSCRNDGSSALVFRPLHSDEQGLLEEATLENMNWCGQRFTMCDILRERKFAHYTRVDADRGDFALAAVRQGDVVGVVWAQFLGSADPGYGYVDDFTPEVSLWVHSEARKRGIGRQLLRAVVQAGRQRGFQQLSLSVEEGNHARELYESEGFVAVAGREEDGVMIREL
ncbi:GNAT family N-acetyltransferase [Corynebacterium heidelbergense]|nr:GNAT family N-acetyltransferase [Corynebacterium heidelbergense]